MFGTISRMRPKAGREQEVIKHLEDWDRTRRPGVKGALGGCCYRSEKNPGELIMAVMFQDKDSYFANASDPEQDRWYQKLLGLLDREPTWEDGEIVTSFGLPESWGKQRAR